MAEEGMFAQARSLWQRVTGRQPAPITAAPAAEREERRVWVRYQTDVATQCEVAGMYETCLSARIRDISRGGMKLHVKRCFKPGDLLTVGLPVPDGEYSITVLACVVYVKELSDGEWALGCNFARELSEEDLARFGAAKVRPATADNRLWERFPCNVEASFTVVVDRTVPRQAARVVNISASGVAFLVDREIKAGTLLSADLHAIQQPFVLSILACVVHVTARDSQWILGCDFIHEVDEKDLEVFRSVPAEGSVA
jgi:hypothetical protein